MARATSSLPEPLSPRIRQVALVPATRPICVSMSRMAALSPTSSLSTLQLVAQRAVLGRQRLLLPQLVDGVAELLGDGDGELQVLGVQRLVRVGAVEVDQAQHAVAEDHGAQIRLVAPRSDRLSRLRR